MCLYLLVRSVLGRQPLPVAAEMTIPLEWSYDSMCVITLSDQNDVSMIMFVDGINFTVTLIFLNTI